MKPRLLDLYCCAGGAAMGYAQAGFEVVGVDIKPQPRYPFEFHQGDALTYPLEGFDAYHASPPCQGNMIARHIPSVGAVHNNTPELIAPTRERLLSTSKPFIIENVPGAPLKDFFQLSGMMFQLKVIRKRWFEIHGFEIGFLPPPARYRNAREAGYIPYAKGESNKGSNLKQIWTRPRVSKAMGIDWMLLYEMNQAIPPAYTKFIGEYLIKSLR